jgi:hypothetical protein
MIVQAECPTCTEHIEKEVKMLPHFLPYKTACWNCGTLVVLEYREAIEKSIKESQAT